MIGFKVCPKCGAWNYGSAYCTKCDHPLIYIPTEKELPRSHNMYIFYHPTPRMFEAARRGRKRHIFEFWVIMFLVFTWSITGFINPSSGKQTDVYSREPVVSMPIDNTSAYSTQESVEIYGIVTGTNGFHLNVRPSPNCDVTNEETVIRKLNSGDRVRIYETGYDASNGKWYRIGSSEWVYAEYISIEQ